MLTMDEINKELRVLEQEFGAEKESLSLKYDELDLAAQNMNNSYYAKKCALLEQKIALYEAPEQAISEKPKSRGLFGGSRLNNMDAPLKLTDLN